LAELLQDSSGFAPSLSGYSHEHRLLPRIKNV
jgi:hypothetical protein